MVGGEGETNCRLEPELSGAYELLGRLENKPLVFLAHWKQKGEFELGVLQIQQEKLHCKKLGGQEKNALNSILWTFKG